MEYRVGELAKEAGVSVELLRSYQSRGLLPPPRRQGRVALYDGRHLERLVLIRELKQRGYSLKMIDRALTEPGAVPDAGMIDAERPSDEEPLTLNEVARRTRVPPGLLRSLQASGVLRPRRFGADLRYTTADVRAVRLLMGLIGSGLPMEELMAVARAQLDAAAEVARGTVELFMRYGREPLRRAGLSKDEEAEQVVVALRVMIHATASLMTYNFQRMVLNAAQEAIDGIGSKAERAALRRAISRRGLELAIPA